MRLFDLEMAVKMFFKKLSIKKLSIRAVKLLPENPLLWLPLIDELCFILTQYILCIFQVFQQRLTAARRIVVVGNGGIATELVYGVKCLLLVVQCRSIKCLTTMLITLVLQWYNSRLDVRFTLPTYDVNSMKIHDSVWKPQLFVSCEQLWDRGMWGGMGHQGQVHSFNIHRCRCCWVLPAAAQPRQVWQQWPSEETQVHARRAHRSA